jgi:hypothetical protein
MYYRDAAIFRYDDEKVKVVSEIEFINEFKRRANDPFWASVQYIQTTIKSRIGLGKPYIFTFNAPCYKRDTNGNIGQSYDGDLNFDYK